MDSLSQAPPITSPTPPSASSPVSPAAAPAADRSLLSAVRTEDVEAVKRLAPTADLTVSDRFGATALHIAAAKGSTEIITVLLGVGADANRMDGRGNTPLMVAALHGHNNVIDVLAAAGAKIDVLNTARGMTALCIALSNKHITTVQLLTKLGASVKGVAGSHVPLHVAASANFIPAITALVDAGADLHQRAENGDTIMHAAHYSDTSLLRTLAAMGAPLDVPNNAGLTPLHLAVMSGFGRDFFISHNVSIDGTAQVDAPLIEAIKRCVALEQFLNAGADPNRVTRDGLSPLALVEQLSCYGSNPEYYQRAAKVLAQRGARSFRQAARPSEP